MQYEGLSSTSVSQRTSLSIVEIPGAAAPAVPAPALRIAISFARWHFLTCVNHTAHVIDIGWTSVCPSVCPSVTRWYCVETPQPIVKLSSLPGSPMILYSFLRTKLFPGIPMGTPNGDVKCKGVGKSCNFRPISRYSS